MPWADVHTIPYLDRALPVRPPDATLNAGEPGRSIQAPVLVAASSAPGHSAGQRFPVAGPGRTGRYTPPSRPGGWLHVSHAEDDHHAVGGPQAGVHKPYDAMDDALDVRILHHDVSEWAGPILDNLQHSWCSDSRFRYRVGAAGVCVFVPATLRRAGYGSRAGIPGGGDGDRCGR